MIREKTVKTTSVFYLIFGIIIAVCLLAGRYTEAQAASAVRMNPGQTKTLTVPKSYKNVTWSSSKKKVASVNKKGKATALAAGTAVITAKSGNKSRRFTIKVEKIQLNHSKLTLNVGDTKRLRVQNSLGKVKWTSDSGAAKVDSNGNVKAVKQGKAVIAAKVFGKIYRCNITVKPKKPNPTNPKEYSILIKVGNKTFSGKIFNNDTGQELIKKFPMTISMNELNNNEKYYYAPYRLPVNTERITSIHTGDLMLYGTDCLVLFYKNFNTSYSYTRLGYIENPSGLEDALGRGTVTVELQLK